MNPFKAIKEYFTKKNDEWTTRLFDLGFHAVTFPIMLKEGNDIDVVCTLEDFANDPDFYFHEFDERNVFIDSMGQLWTWKYDTANKTNLPASVKSILTVDDVKKIISEYFKGTKVENEVHDLNSSISKIDSLLNAIADRL